MRHALAMILAAALTPTLAQAQSACIGLKDDAERLKCYDDAAIAKPPAPAEDPVITKAKAAIVRNLKDPVSARFEGVVKRPGAVCGWVNAKNSMGGYAGRSPFVYVTKENRGWVLSASMLPIDADPAFKAAETYCTNIPGF